MPFTFRGLDGELRDLMVAEIQAAAAEGTLYSSKRFTDAGRARWSELLVEAARGHDEHWLAYQLELIGAMKGSETGAKPSGGYTIAHVPNTAEETLADGEFNRYYMCAVCRRAITVGVQVTVYRAKRGGTTRPESEALIGSTYDPSALVQELRTTPGHELTKPNSGLSIHLASG